MVPDRRKFGPTLYVNADYRCPLLNQLEMSGCSVINPSFFYVIMDFTNS